MPLSIQNPPAPRSVRLGFIQLTDAAPLIVAAEAGLFAAAGLQVELTRELGWASIHDRLVLGDLDYIHALGPSPLAASLGLGTQAVECVGLMALSYNGNAVTLDRKWWDQGIRSGEDFAAFVRQEKWRRRFTLGVVAPASSHHFLLRQWLAGLELLPERDVEIVNLPPGQFLRNLQAHTIDGACVGEPWNTYAVQQGIGWCPTDSPTIAADHPEKTLMTTRERLERDPDTSARLVAAIQVAAEWCEDPERIPDIARLLGRAPYLQIPAGVVEASLRSSEATLGGAPVTGLHFGRGQASVFDEAGLRWIEEGLRACQLLDQSIPGGRYALTRYYPEAVVKNAQQYRARLQSQVFTGFLSER